MSDERSEAIFHDVDDLDTKGMTAAIDNYERAFITVRDALAHMPQYCCDDLSDRLAMTQVIADTLRREALIRKP
tara:strand:- start:261 stop:482 length:222 start_codon:yes stop_codon:yes gene_type:complete